MVLCANRHFTGVTVTFYWCFGSFTGFRDGQGDNSVSTNLYDNNFPTFFTSHLWSLYFTLAEFTRRVYVKIIFFDSV